NPDEPPQPFALLLQAGGYGRSARLLFEDSFASTLESAIALLLFGRQLAQQVEEPVLPAVALSEQTAALDQLLKARMSRQPSKIAELASSADDPESGIEKT